MPPHALDFPFESVKEEGEYWCEVLVRHAPPVFMLKVGRENNHI